MPPKRNLKSLSGLEERITIKQPNYNKILIIKYKAYNKISITRSKSLNNLLRNQKMTLSL